MPEECGWVAQCAKPDTPLLWTGMAFNDGSDWSIYCMPLASLGINKLTKTNNPQSDSLPMTCSYVMIV